MKKLSILIFVSVLIGSSAAFALEELEATRAAHRAEMTKINRTRHGSKPAAQEGQSSSGGQGFWAREGEQSDLNRSSAKKLSAGLSEV